MNDKFSIKIEEAMIKDAQNLTELTIRSKSYWDYKKEAIESWRDDLTLTDTYIENNQVFKLLKNGVLVGFYAYNIGNESDIKLNFFFIEPKYIGKGYGKILIQDFLKRIETSQFKRVILDADPNAEKFYAQFGFSVIGKIKSSIKDRYLPIMSKDI